MSPSRGSRDSVMRYLRSKLGPSSRIRLLAVSDFENPICTPVWMSDWRYRGELLSYIPSSDDMISRFSNPVSQT